MESSEAEARIVLLSALVSLVLSCARDAHRLRLHTFIQRMSGVDANSSACSGIHLQNKAPRHGKQRTIAMGWHLEEMANS